MTKDSSATARPATPHVIRTTRTNTIMNALKQRAQTILNDTSLDPQSRAIIRYALETNDPWLARLVRSAGAGNGVVEEIDAEPPDDGSTRKRIEALAEIICGGGEEPAGALLVLMATIQKSAEPRVIAHTVKHFAFTRCGEFNLFGMVDD
ncbi:MAG TPA: hypothetical protein VJR02_23420 [Pyrinomonadaceae bacterium]|nr:hypothetical protein [Pyrinomonadaceae bacterium]